MLTDGKEVAVAYYNPGNIGRELQFNDESPIHWSGTYSIGKCTSKHTHVCYVWRVKTW